MKGICWIIIAFFVSFLMGEKTTGSFFNINIGKQTKGIAAILIILGHTINGYGLKEFSWLNVGWLCVAIFFFWSGYGVMYSYVVKKEYLHYFWRDRVIKLFVPFLGIHIVYIVFKCLMGERYTFIDIILSVLGQCTIVDNAWYPVAVLIFYILFYYIFKRKISLKKKILKTTVGVTGITIIERFLMGTNNDWWLISNLAFLVGIGAYIYKEKIEKNWKRSMILCMFVMCIGGALLPVWSRIVGYSFWIYLVQCNIISASIALFIVVGVSALNRKNLFSMYLGEISYELYLIHGLWIFWVGKIQLLVGVKVIIVLGGSIISATVLHKINSQIINNLIHRN